VPVTVRDLAHRTAEVLRSVQQDRRRILVTSNGRPVAALVPIDEDELFDQALEAYLPSEEQISREILAGETESLASIVEELGL
jgi:prevent-host-death family protein